MSEECDRMLGIHPEQTIENLNIVREMMEGYECVCDPDVGFTCEQCFVASTAMVARNNMIKLQSRIKELENEVMELKESQRWRKMTDEMPIFPDKTDMSVHKKVVYAEGVGSVVYWNLTGPLTKGYKEE